MAGEIPEVLHLRLRGRTVVDEPPDVAAFARRASPAALREAAIAVMPGARALDPEAPLLIFVQPACFGIPAPSAEFVSPDLASWSFRPTAFGYLASVPRATGRARAAWVIAACLPLVLGTEATVHAAPSVQRPKTVSGPPALPEAPVVEAAEPEAQEPTAEPTAAPDDGDAATREFAPVENPLPEADPGPVRNTAIVDAAWEGVDGFDVMLELKGGRKMRGRVGAVQPDTFTLIEAGTGAVLVLPKSGVLSLSVVVPKPLPGKTGIGALVTGGVLTGVGTPVFVTGIAFVAICPSCAYLHLPLLIIGGGMLGAGIPLLVRGAKNREKYRKILQEHRVGPVVSRTQGGWSGGVRFRF
jgi:hypothetical protein